MARFGVVHRQIVAYQFMRPYVLDRIHCPKKFDEKVIR